jgi:hypothetical protein
MAGGQRGQGAGIGVDLRDQVSTAAVKEDIVLSGPTAPASYAFRLTGATAWRQW